MACARWRGEAGGGGDEEWRDPRRGAPAGRAVPGRRRQEVRARRVRSRRRPSASTRRTSRAQGGAGGRRRSALRAAGQALRPGPLGGAADLPGDGRRRQGRRDQARDVGRQPAGVPGLLLQGADQRGARPRLALALLEVPAGARPDRHLQPQLLRGDARRARPPADPRRPEAAAEAGGQGDLGRALRGHPRLRALPRAQRRRGAEVLPQRLERGAEAPLPRAHREAGEELEVLPRRRRRARALGRVHARLRGGDPRHRDAGGALVRRAGGQQVVHAHGRRRGGRSMHSPGSTSPTPRSARRRRRSSRRRGAHSKAASADAPARAGYRLRPPPPRGAEAR